MQIMLAFYTAVMALIKPICDVIEPLLDLARPVCGPAVDFIRNLTAAMESILKTFTR